MRVISKEELPLMTGELNMKRVGPGSRPYVAKSLAHLHLPTIIHHLFDVFLTL